MRLPQRQKKSQKNGVETDKIFRTILCPYLVSTCSISLFRDFFALLQRNEKHNIHIQVTKTRMRFGVSSTCPRPKVQSNKVDQIRPLSCSNLASRARSLTSDTLPGKERDCHTSRTSPASWIFVLSHPGQFVNPFASDSKEREAHGE